MEQNIAILIADLSGYSSLTEAHGAVTAAKTIDKYLGIVQDCLIGNTKLHQRVGDEVMVVSDSADELMRTAVMLIQNCSKENNFLQIHGGLHYGRILKHDNHYFGSPVNHTARIAAKANKGTLWCSSTFISNLSDPSSFTFSSKGKHYFKNVTKQIDVSELILENTNSFKIDPVCRMMLHNRAIAIAHPQKQNIFFCSADCLEIYKKSEFI